MAKEEEFDWQTPEERQEQIDQALNLREQASRRGLKFEAHLIPGIAEKVLDQIALGAFRSPGEFIFEASKLFWEIEQYPDLRLELLRRKIQEAEQSGEGRIMDAETLLAELKTKSEEWKKEKPAVWQKTSCRTE